MSIYIALDVIITILLLFYAVQRFYKHPLTEMWIASPEFKNRASISGFVLTFDHTACTCILAMEVAPEQIVVEYAKIKWPFFKKFVYPNWYTTKPIIAIGSPDDVMVDIESYSPSQCDSS